MNDRFTGQEIPNWIGGREESAASTPLEKMDPTTGTLLCRLARSQRAEVQVAVRAARAAFPAWAETPPVKRGEVLLGIAMALRGARDEVARVVARETGKSLNASLSETDAAIALGTFMAGEGQRLYGRTTTSAARNRHAMTVREPMGVAGLIVAANTPVANMAWKVFPALVCGNTVVVKAAEDTPVTAWLFARIAHEAGLPPGVLNVVHGLGREAGDALVRADGVDVVSFTGSTGAGREVAAACAERLRKVSLELGGKNPFVVCDDADLENAVDWAIQSAFSNAGQRCAAASRLIIFDPVYEPFRALLLAKTKALKVGPRDEDDLGPVINERQLGVMLSALERARREGAVVLVGGQRLSGPEHRDGFYMAPTLVEGAGPSAEISTMELFGPITCLYRVPNLAEALRLANDSPYGLTACIHTRSLHRALHFCRRVEAGVAMVNAGTFGSEPHMPFGGAKQSGNGTREPGTEALDVYSQLKDIYISIDVDRL